MEIDFRPSANCGNRLIGRTAGRSLKERSRFQYVDRNGDFRLDKPLFPRLGQFGCGDLGFIRFGDPINACSLSFVGQE